MNMDIQGTEQLVAKKCQPCEGGVDPCTLPEAQEQLKMLTGWYLTHDGQRIRDHPARQMASWMDAAAEADAP